ncbi:glycosyltransferase family 4 protein [Metapseudomonas otitidis]|uniref:MraY family glycosyltransferase n=1 Tax=Metapseudomonas otitidis TaxID=319939 RepID=UPI00254045BD|nr:glycosyltransferase family 4 protein [Pseudomonas otitidis]WIF65911.1 glycosyltransferase family 4 protein [Pseudomonas otitidis]
MNFLLLLPFLALAAFLLTGVMRRYALSRSLMDVPNDRSSHKLPTPRGGGVAVVLCFFISLCALLTVGLIEWSIFVAFMGAGTSTALLGFLDDHGHIAARWRLLGHFAAAAWALFWLGGFPPLTIMGVELDLGWIGHLLAAFYLVWMLNLYNFMDGIDGIASVEAVCACGGGALLIWFAASPTLPILPLCVAFSVVGFLFWNFPPAKIFMGDAGSGFLGITLGLLTIQAAWLDMHFFWGWLILLGVFITDATFTLIRRLLNGEKPYEAHRSHAYQYASRLYGRHLPVTLAVMAINIIWLLPLALLVGTGNLNDLVGLALAYAPLVLLCIKYRAGVKERSA